MNLQAWKQNNALLNNGQEIVVDETEGGRVAALVELMTNKSVDFSGGGVDYILQNPPKSEDPKGHRLRDGVQQVSREVSAKHLKVNQCFKPMRQRSHTIPMKPTDWNLVSEVCIEEGWSREGVANLEELVAFVNTFKVVDIILCDLS